MLVVVLFAVVFWEFAIILATICMHCGGVHLSPPPPLSHPAQLHRQLQYHLALQLFIHTSIHGRVLPGPVIKKSLVISFLYPPSPFLFLPHQQAGHLCPAIYVRFLWFYKLQKQAILLQCLLVSVGNWDWGCEGFGLLFDVPLKIISVSYASREGCSHIAYIYAKWT